MIKASKALIFCCILFLASLGLLLSPSLRKSVQRLKYSNKVLSVVSGDLYPQSPIRRVVKSMTPEGIVLSVYTLLESKEVLLGTINIGDPFDAYYELNSRPTNLALNDMDGDGSPEIIAPSYNFQWQPKLNIFRFNKENQQFETY